MSSSSRNSAGVPCSSTSAVTDAPPTCSTPSTRRADVGQIVGSSALGSAGGLEGWWSASTSPCRGPAGGAFLLIGLHPLRRAHAEQLQAVREHDPGRLVDPGAGAVDVGDLVVALRTDPAGVVPALVGAGEVLQVAGDPVRCPQLGSGCHAPWELAQRSQ